MTEQAHSNSLYLTVWIWLVGLLIAGLTIVALPVPKLAAVLLIFAIAAVKAGLVIRNYMHLTSEHLLIFAIALVPALLFIGFVIALLPDIAFRR